jgi:hypothetical protein
MAADWAADLSEDGSPETVRATRSPPPPAPRPRLLRHARAEFRAGHHAAAVGAYGELAGERLTAADRKRLEIARRRV